MKQFPLTKNGAMAKGLDNCHQAALDLFEKIQADDKFLHLFKPETDIVIWAPKGKSLNEISVKSQEVFDRCAENDLHLALFSYPAQLLPDHWNKVEKDQKHVVCLRSCLMKWEHLEWVDEIWDIIQNASL